MIFETGQPSFVAVNDVPIPDVYLNFVDVGNERYRPHSFAICQLHSSHLQPKTDRLLCGDH